MTVIPLVVSLLITGVASVSDIKSIGRLGGRTLVTFVLLLIGVAAIVIPVALAMFALLPPHGALELPPGAVEAANEISAGGQAQTFSAWLVSLLPANPIAAAASGAMMPLILFTLLLALAIARSPEASRQTLTRFFRALSDAMLILVRWIILAAPLGVFALVLPLAVHAGGTLAGAIGFYVVAYSIASVAVTLLLYPVVAIAGRIPMRRFARGRTAAAAHCLQLELVDRVVAGARRDSREELAIARAGHRICPASRRFHVQDCGAGVVDDRRAFRRLVLRRAASAPAALRRSLSRPCSSPSPCRAFRAARSSC